MKRFTCLLLSVLLCLSLCSCAKDGGDDTTIAPTEDTKQTTSATEAPTEAPSYSEEEISEQTRFNTYLDALFVEMAESSDTISVHYLMQRPEDFGITSYPISFGEVMMDPVAYEAELKAELEDLKAFSYEKLTSDQQLTYDILKYYLESSLDMVPYYYYSEPLSSSTGMHAMMTIYFAEYGLYREQDVKDYLGLMKQIRPYFEQLIAFEEKRIELGIFMSDELLAEIITQCEAIVADATNNFYLNDLFAKQLAQVPGLSTEAQASYLEEHKQLVLSDFAPAYQYLIDTLKTFEGKGGKVTGAITYPDGAKYVEALNRQSIASGKNLSEIIEKLEKTNAMILTQVQTLITLNPSLADEMMSFTQPTDGAEDIMKQLIQYYSETFPGLNGCDYEILYVAESLEDSMSPAFYMIPSLDGYKTENTIYINRGNIDGNGLFTTLAHEGYPGHMLQNTYFRAQGSHPIRAFLSYLTYTEGWATYVENSAYAALDGVSGQLAKVLAANSQFSLNMLALVDLGINYEGWTFSETCDFFLVNFGIEDAETVKMYYNIFLSDPFSYVPYALGYVELQDILTAAQEKEEENFSWMTFHKKFLSIGPAPAEIVKDRMNR